MDTGFAAEILYKRQLWGSFYLAFFYLEQGQK